MSEEINPRYADGEPVCNGERCKKYGFGNTDDPLNSACFRKNSPCVPALKRDRNRAMSKLSDIGKLYQYNAKTLLMDRPKWMYLVSDIQKILEG